MRNKRNFPILGDKRFFLSFHASSRVDVVYYFPCLVISVCYSAQFRMDRKKSCVKLSVRPSRGLMDEKFVVLVQNVPPGFQLTVHAHHKCEDGHSWEAFGHYTSDASGTVDGTWFNASK